jgi:hypothetical protein
MDQSLLAAPHGFSQRATSFIASWCQGIHRMPLSCSIRLLALAGKPPCTETIHSLEGPQIKSSNSIQHTTGIFIHPFTLARLRMTKKPFTRL